MLQVLFARPRCSALACAIGLLAASCNATPLPGTQLGTYNVIGTLGTNTCGAGLGAPNPWSFTVQLSEDTSTTPPTFYWLSSDGTQWSNVMSSATQVTFSSSVTSNVDGVTTTTDAGVSTTTEGACDLTQTTEVPITLAAGLPPTSFTGTVTYSFQAALGVSASTDCTDQLASSGGTYDTLPCTASYSLTAKQQ